MPHATPLARRLRRWLAPAKPTAPLRKAWLACTPLEARDVPASVGGTVYHDTDVNGVRTAPALEPGLPGRVVYADLNGNGKLDAASIGVASANVPLPIPDTVDVVSTIGVSGYAGTLTDVNVTVDITHARDAELYLVVIAPDGTHFDLTAFNGGNGVNYATTTFDDQAATRIQDGSAPFNGSYRPQAPLASLNGRSPNGTWTFIAYDFYGGNTGTLNAWSLQLATTAAATEPTATTDPSGAFTLAGVPAGTVTIAAVPPVGWVTTAPAADAVTLADSTSGVTGRLFGQVEANSVRGALYQDNNGNGTRDLLEPALADRPVQLVAAGSGVTTTVNTDANGLFVFAPVAAGGYTVRPAPLLGWATTQPAAGSYSVTTQSGGAVGGLAFGLQGNGVAPTADVVDVTPDPRAVPVTAVTIAFNEAVRGFDLADLTLTRGGATLGLTGATLAAGADQGTWTLTLPADLTAANGPYTLTLAAGGVTDYSGAANAAAASDSWVMSDTTAPTVAIAAGSKTRLTPIDSVTFTVSEPVLGFTASDLSLTRDGGPNLLTAAQPLAAGTGGLTYTLTGLAAITGGYGTYTLSVPAGAFTDRAPNPLAGGATATWFNAGGVGGETRVGTPAAGYLYNAAVAVDAAGAAVAVWTAAAQDGSGAGVYGQRTNADGTPTGSAFRVNTATAGDQADAAVGRNARGDTVVVWTSADQDGSGGGVYGQLYSPAGTPVGAEFRVNATTAGDQSAAAVAVAADGRFVVTWQSAGQDGSGYGVYGRRFAAAGAPAGGEFLVNTATAGDQVRPAVAVDAAGGAVVAWEDDSGADGSNGGVYARRYGSDGAAVGGPVRVNTVVQGAQVRPAVAVAPAGDFVVAWSSEFDAAGPNPNVAAQRYNAAGLAAGAETVISSTDVDYNSRPGVAVDAAGNALIVWHSFSSNGDAGGRRWASDGTLSPEFNVNTTTAGYQGVPAAAITPNGTATVVWDSSPPGGSGAGVYAQRLAAPADAAGPVVIGVRAAGEAADLAAGGRRTAAVAGLVVAFDEPVVGAATPAAYRLTRNGLDVTGRLTVTGVVTTAATGRTEATLVPAAPLADGDYVLTVRSAVADAAGNRLDGAGDGGFAEAFTLAFTVAAGGALQGGEARANTATAGNQEEPRVAVAPDGTALVVWQSAAQDGSGWGVYGQRYGPSGAAAGGEFRVNTATAGDQNDPTVTATADGAFVVVWTSGGQDGGGQGVYAQLYAADGTPVGGETLVNATTAGDQDEPAAAATAGGGFVVTWTGVTQDNGTAGVYGRRFAADGTPAGDEFAVNAYSPGGQSQSAVAAAADGSFVVVWQDDAQDGAGAGVYGRRFAADGTPRGGDFLVTTTTAGSQTSPTVGSDAAGNFTALWLSNQTGANAVYARRFAADGTPRGAEAVVSGDGGSPRVAVGPAGDVVAVWDGIDSVVQSSYGTFARRYDAAGAAVGGPFRLNAAVVGNQNLPAAAVNASGDFVATWRTDTSSDTSGFSVVTARYGRLATPVAAAVGGEAAVSPPGTRFGGPVTTVAVTFSGTLSTAGGTTGTTSVTNPANWQVSRGGVPIANGIGSVAAATDAATGRTTATVTFATALRADGAYTLTALPAVRDAAGTAIDGDFDGVAGGAANFYFGVAAVAVAGAETQANAGVTAGDQQLPAAASDAAGNSVVVWQTPSATAGNGLDVVGRRVSAAGVAGAEFTLGGAGDQAAPAVAADAAGNFVVAYVGPDAAGSGVFAQRFTAAGVAVGTPVAVNATTALAQTEPAVAVDADGDFVVAWASDGQDGSGTGVYARRFRADGTSLGGEFRVNTFTPYNQAGAAVACDAVGNFTVAWQSDNQDGDAQGVYAQRFSPAGAPVGGEFRVNGTTTGDQSQVAVGADAAGNLVFAWHSIQAGNYDVYTRRFSAAGVALTGETRANTTLAGDQMVPSVAVDADGDAVVTWQSSSQDGSGYGIYSRRYSADGTVVTNEIRVNSTAAGDQTRPAVAVDAAGDAIVAWQSNSQDGDGLGVYVQRYRANNLAPLAIAPPAPVTLLEDAAATTVVIREAFLDIEDGAGLVDSVQANNNTALVSATVTNGVLTVTPLANANGTATLTLRATDTAGGFVDTALVVTVAAVNDAPTVTLTGNPPAVPQGAGAQSVAGFAAFTAGPADEAGQTASYSVTANTNAALFSVAPAVNAVGTLTYTPAAGQSGTAVVTVQGKDNGGTANGGVDLSVARTFTITVNAPPRVAATAVNGGGAQRSSVTSLVVTFTRAVSFTGFSVAAAFQLTRDGVGLVGGFTATTATVNGTTAVTLGNFTGANTAGGSLADGTYTLAVNGSQVQAADGQLLDGDNNGTAGGNYTTGFHRYLADFDGDTAVDGNDLAIFAGAFNTVEGDAGYLAYLDLDGDGAVDGNDLAIFAQRFNTVL